MPRRSRFRVGGLTLLLCAAGVALEACGNVTAGGVTGEATVLVSGDADSGGSPLAGAARSASTLTFSEGPARTDDGGNSGPSADEAEGEIEAEFGLLLIDAGGSSIQLTDADVRIRVDVQGREEVVAVRRTVPALVYQELRVVFTDMKIEIESGLVIGGEPVLGELKVELEDETLVVSRNIDLLVGDGDTVELLVDLNAKEWLLAVDPLLRTVAEDIVANAISVTAR